MPRIQTLLASALLFGCTAQMRAADIFVPAGASFQAALDSARPGDTITLQAGAVYSGNFRIPNKGATSEWITIQSSAMGQLPAGARVTPAMAASMPKLVSSNSYAVLIFDRASNHVRLQGLEIAAKPGVYNWGLVTLGDGSETSISDLPSDVIFDRCWIHGDPVVGSKRGITMNSRSTTVMNSWLNDFMSDFQDTQAIGGWGGTGPFDITNNHLEATGESFAYGGAIPSVPGVIAADFTIRRNHFYKPVSWRNTNLVVKNHLEFKFGRRILIEGNVFDYIWNHSQAGYALQLTVRTENGAIPGSVIEDLTFSRNLVRHASGGVNFLGKDDYDNGGSMRRVVIRDNIFEDIDGTKWGGLGRLFQLLHGTDTVTIDHNTALQNGTAVVVGGPLPSTGFVFTNNVVNGPDGTIGLSTYAPGATLRRNVLVAGIPSYYPVDNYFPASAAAVGFIDLAAGNYTLRSDSPYLATSTDGRPAGADVAAVTAATANVVIEKSAVVTVPNPTPTPTPAPTPTPNPPPAPTVGTFTIINTATDRPVPGFETVASGTTVRLNRAALGLSGISVIANVNPLNVGSVLFRSNSQIVRVDGTAPYSIAADASGDFAPWKINPGTYALAAMPWMRTAQGSTYMGAAITMTLVLE